MARAGACLIGASSRGIAPFRDHLIPPSSSNLIKALLRAVLTHFHTRTCFLPTNYRVGMTRSTVGSEVGEYSASMHYHELTAY